MKKIVSIILIFTMIFTVLPLSVFSEDIQRNENSFADISQNDWYYDDVNYVVNNKIFMGTSDNTFSPIENMTRAMYVTILGRIENVDINQYVAESKFSDVVSNEYYAPYVSWAIEKGITLGISDTEFDPDGLITREDMACFTVRFLDYIGFNYPENVVTTQPSDLDTISNYAKQSVLKLWALGLLKGDENGNFNPTNSAIRAEVATLCSRMHPAILECLQPIETSQPTASPTPIPTQKPSSGTSTYSITYETNGGSPLASTSYRRGEKLNTLPIPYKQGSIFDGWYYDNALENRVLDTNKATKSTTLYAKYIETSPLTESETPQFASALDQNADFSINIRVKSDEEMTINEIKEGIIAKNLSSVNQNDFIEISGEANLFTISAKSGAFEKGATYKITLDDERIIFDGYSSSVRNYNFTIAKEEVLALSLSNKLKYVEATDVTDMTKNGEVVSQLSIPMVTIGDDTNLTNVNLESGTFVYKGTQTLMEGDTLAIYEGIIPDKRVLDDKREGADGNIAYVTVSSVDDNTISYKSADSKNVLFTPDMLPVSVDADIDGVSDNNSVTLPKNTMDYSGDIYANIGIDSQTTIDVGDFIVFYSGSFGDSETRDISYGQITSVNLLKDNYIIAYKNVTTDELMATMDIYNNEQIDGDTLLEGVDIDALEKNIEKQAQESGFAEMASTYLAEAALRTESFTVLNDEIDLTNIKMTKEDGTLLSQDEISLMSQNKVFCKITKLNAIIGKELEHFDNVTGVRLLLEVGLQITVDINDSSQIVIDVTGEFEQEVKVGLNISGGAVWSWFGIIPYISEYEATTSVDLYDYTGIDIDATIVTREKQNDQWISNEDLKNIGEELKNLIDTNEAYIGDGKGTVAEGLADKYKAMLQNESDWVELFNQDISSTKGAVDPFHVLAYEIGISFVVSANMNVSVGFDFYYQNAKRYSYSVLVFAKNVTSDVVDIQEERYEFNFYVMGALGIRAGVLLQAEIGFFDTDLDSIGFSAEAGAYVKVWGYFFYSLKYTASQGKSSNYAGALVFEVGIYLEIKFLAQAGNGLYSYNPTLYEDEWPLWNAGVVKNVQNFAYLQEETPEFKLKKSVTAAKAPDELFNMKYMNLKNGNVAAEVYDDATNYKIEMTNQAFTYDTSKNLIKVTPGDSKELDGQMIITWTSAPLAFTSAPLRRVINLHWDKLNDGYYIAFDSNGGNIVDMIITKYNASITQPENPTRTGYIFGGWFEDEEFNKPYTFPSAMPDVDTLLYAKWTPCEDTDYKVEHYKQNLENNLYELVETQDFDGVTDSIVETNPNSYKGFITPTAQNVTIKPDGSAKVCYYYTRSKYTVTFDLEIDGVEDIVIKSKYGAKITAPIVNAMGYEFKNWNDQVAETIPDSNLTYTALWNTKSDTSYRVEHYLQNTVGDGYSLSTVDFYKGNTDENIGVSQFINEPVGFTYAKSTAYGEEITSVSLSSDGKLVIKLYYDRNSFELSFDLNEDADSDMPQKIYCRFDQTIAEPQTPIKEGYKLVGWYTNEQRQEQDKVKFGTLKMPNNPITLYGKMDFDSEVGYPITYNGLYGATNSNEIRYTVGSENISLIAPGERIGYTFEGWYTDSEYKNKVSDVAIPKNSIGAKVFYARWTVNQYPITYYGIEDGSNANLSAYTIESSSIKLIEPTRVGYTFNGWYADSGHENQITGFAIEQGSTGAKEFYAKWTPNNYTVMFYGNYDNVTQIGSQQFIYDEAQTLIDIDRQREGYTFVGWNTKPDGTGTLYKVSDSVKNLTASGGIALYAKWKPITYIITYVLDGGNNHPDNKPTYNADSNLINLKNPTKTGYTFDGWYDNSNFKGDKVNIIEAGSIGDKIFYAKFTVNTYKVQFFSNGGIGEVMSPMQFTYGQSKKLNANTFKRAGYVFSGWSTSQVGEKNYDDEAVVSNLSSTNGVTVKLYAVWTENTYTIKFDKGGLNNPVGTWWNDKECSYTEKFIVPGDGYISSWEISSGGSLTPGQTAYELCNDNDGIITLTPTWETGNGTASSPYSIKDRQGLANLKDKNEYYRLICDIDLSDSNWNPISSFSGTLDGNTRSIKNMKVVTSASMAYSGLFGILKDATVKNLNLNVDIAGKGMIGYNYISTTGGLVGETKGTVNIDNVHVKGNITANTIVGGMIGSVSGSTTIKNSSTKFTYSTVSGYNNGWLAGTKAKDATFTQSNNYNGNGESVMPNKVGWSIP